VWSTAYKIAINGAAVKKCSAAGVVLLLGVLAYADAATYQQAFVDEVVAFANLNRLHQDRLNRDVHADCYIPVTIATTVVSDGSVRDLTIVRSSSVPVVDKYFRYVIEQAAPYEPLANHYDPVPDEVTITYEFRLDATLWGHDVSAPAPCRELEPRDKAPD
jgi:hypothetical protein